MKEEWKDYYIYLENLRESGVTNMFGATPYLMKEFHLDHDTAIEILGNWMTNYHEICAKYFPMNTKEM